MDDRGPRTSHLSGLRAHTNQVVYAHMDRANRPGLTGIDTQRKEVRHTKRRTYDTLMPSVCRSFLVIWSYDNLPRVEIHWIR